MDELLVRPMTAAEFDGFRTRLIRNYAADRVRAGTWSADDAENLSAGQVDSLLPQGVHTPGMLLLMAETIGGEAVGHAWVELQRAYVGGDAWIFDIEVLEHQRGKGFGRALLAATERESAAHGVGTIGLNVFGTNTVARGLYESSGYETVTVQMRKRLDA